MQLNIAITKKNKDKIFQLINSILEDEQDIETESECILNNDLMTSGKTDFLKIPKALKNLENGTVAVYTNEYVNENKRINSVGSWGQFNSFFPIKAALRILANFLDKEKAEQINLEEFVKICLVIFKEKNLNQYRGFPSSDKDSARGRFVWHFLATAYEMGLLKITESSLNYKGLPSSLLDWNKILITITKEGLEFSNLPNNIFDNISKEQVLTKEEAEWIISFLRKIDKNGYKEYDLLKNIVSFLKEGHKNKDELLNWFRQNKTFIDFIRSWSRKADNSDQQSFQDQISNLSGTFTASKIALLRELGIVNNKRNDYTLIGGM